MAKRTLEQRHSVTLRIGTPVTIPWVSKKGVTLELADDKEKVAEIRITGALIHIRRAGKKNWVQFTFKDFLNKLVQ
jgi:SH3-like domain-containing protein